MGLTKGKSRLTDLISCYDKVTRLVDDGKAVDVVFLDFSEAFDPVPRSILRDKASGCEMSRYWVRWVKNWLDGAQRGVGNGAVSGWRPVTAVDTKLGGTGDSLEGQEPCRGIWLAGSFGQSSMAGKLRRINAGFWSWDEVHWRGPSLPAWVTT